MIDVEKWLTRYSKRVRVADFGGVLSIPHQELCRSLCAEVLHDAAHTRVIGDCVNECQEHLLALASRYEKGE